MIPLDSLVDSGEGVVEVDIVIVMLEAPPPRPSKILTSIHNYTFCNSNASYNIHCSLIYIQVMSKIASKTNFDTD